MVVITFFGHADFVEKDIFRIQIIENIRALAGNEKVEFYLGGYGNFDLFALKCCRDYKKQYKNCKINLIVPYLTGLTKEKVNADYYDEIIYPALEDVYPRFAICKRNEWMVDKADVIITYLNRHYGGTYSTIKYAYSHHKPVINLYSGKYEL